MKFEKIGLMAPSILFPKKGTDLSKWAVVACDQYTSEPEYWQRAANYVADAPSTLNIVFPEVFLEEADDSKQTRIEEINKLQKQYVDDGTLEELPEGFMLVDRKTSQADSRKGLVVALDLEHYDYNKGSKTLIRATEGTIVDRLPPRIKIREKSPIELPHIMVLIDDPSKSVIEPLFNKNAEKICDIELMENSGHLNLYHINDETTINEVAENLSKLADPETFNNKYQTKDSGVLLFAMGDGNHSLATAKAIWEKLKESGAEMDHPARFALVELVNVHDDGLTFEPIHRVLFNTDENKINESMDSFYKNQGSELNLVSFKNFGDAKQALENSPKDSHQFISVSKNGVNLVSVKNPKLTLEAGTLQDFLDTYLNENNDVTIDYIHGEEVLNNLGIEDNNIGFYLPGMSKHDLFKTVIFDGALPRKTFSMGEADEKRFYLECRKIIK